MDFQVLDKSYSAGTKRTYTEQGYLLIKDCILARSGVLEYNASDFQPRMYNDRQPHDVIVAYRSADSIRAAAAKFSGAPLTNDHPVVMLDALNTSKYQTGHVNGEVRVEPDPEDPDEVVMVGDILVTDATVIKNVDEKRTEELSNGYYSRYDFEPGVSPTGKRYDCEQLGLRPNHVAVVKAGRNGPLCKVSDSITDNPTKPQEEIPMSTVTINGVSYEASEQVVQAVAQLQAELATCQSQLPTPEDEAAAANAAAAATAEMEALQAQVAEATAATAPEAMDAAVEERAEVLDAARKLIPNFDSKGKSNDVIRMEVVKARCPELTNLDKRPAEYIAARFDALKVAPKGQSTLDSALSQSIANKDKARDGELVNVDAARDKAIEGRVNRWKKSAK